MGPARYIRGGVLHFQPTVTESAECDIVPDNFHGKIATVYNVRDRGLVIISSCGHSGIINTIKHVQSVTGIDNVHALVGGLHLAAAPEALAAKPRTLSSRSSPIISYRRTAPGSIQRS